MEPQASPFVFDGPVPPEDLVGRDAELAALADRARRGRFTLLYGPRRYGKTSLVRRLAHDAAETRDLAVVIADLEGVQTIGDIARRLDDAYRKLPDTALRRALGRGLALLSRHGVRVSGGRVSVRFGDPATDIPVLETLLDLPWEAAGKTGTRVLVVLDEFQAVGDVPAADAVIRSKIQHQRERVSYLFAGSEQGMLRAVFSERARPLYGQAEQLLLDPLPDEALAELIWRKFAETGRDPGDALELLLGAAAGHPQRAAFLADQLWHATGPDGRADGETWLEALERALRAAIPEFEALDRSLTPAQRKAARLLAHGDPLYGAAAARLGLPKSSATTALRDLRARSLVTDDRPPRLVDPLYATWIRERRERP